MNDNDFIRTILWIIFILVISGILCFWNIINQF